MGGICSKRAAVDKSPSDTTLNADGLKDQDPMEPPADETMEKEFEEHVAFSFSDPGARKPKKPQLSRVHSERSTKSKPTTKVSEVSSLLGRASTVGFGKAVVVLDTLGSSMTGLNLGSGFTSGTATKGNKISILAFEVANTIVKGAHLMQSLSKENIKHLKAVVIPSEGVQRLISKDMDELLRIAANDKREELKIFSGEVVRFGNRCKDPQWHNLDRYFAKLETEVIPQKQLKEAAAGVMQQMMTLVQNTAELYHELHALDRFEQDYRRKLQEDENSNVAQIGDNLQILRQELKSQRKHVKSLKKKSLWSKSLEDVIEKLVDIVHFLHLEIRDAFGTADGDQPMRKPINSHQRLGSAGLALHYANVISQIDTLVSRSCSVPSNTRDSLYQGLPPRVKSALRPKLQSFQVKEELTVPQIKSEMEKTLQWLVPIANNTTKAHHGFGWVGEWANTGFLLGTNLSNKYIEVLEPTVFTNLYLCMRSEKINMAHFTATCEMAELNRSPAGPSDLIRIETLYHADKEKTEAYILDLVVWLHHLISQSRAGNRCMRSSVKSPIRPPTEKKKAISSTIDNKSSAPLSALSQEDQEMLRCVGNRRHTPGISKSQEFDTGKARLNKNIKLSKSSSHSPTTESMVKELPSTRRPAPVSFVDFDIDKIKALDVIDRVDTLRNL